jgi:hypothetical protein
MTDREAFEKWAEDNYMLGYSNGKYVSRFTQCAWEGWQADRSQTLLEVIRDDSGCPVEVRVVEAMQGEAAPQPAVPEEVYTALVGVCTAACDGVVLVRYEDWNKIVDWVNGLLSAAKGE